MSEGAIMYPMPSGDPSVATMVLSSAWTMASVSTIFLALRLYCRAARTRKMWWDDYLLLIGWMFLILADILQTVIYRRGYLVTTLTGPVIMPANLASDTAMKLSLAFSKTSFALTLCRFTIISALTDFILAMIPIKVVWGLQMIKREKAGVAIAMGIGCLQVKADLDSVVSRRLAVLSIWIHAEPNATIIAASIPVLRVLLRDARAYYARKYRSGSKYLKSEGEFQSGTTSRAAVRASGHISDDGRSKRSIP
ncbi:hypothetical protein K4K53_009318 [Colletotrichum sp. SAR 10_77]|nr:hypothetical protein K4K52_009704 [Colletotrichum sp. SAR 10_76]KAI8254365.1 hypothetical protein K4K53_009318 [Colletotrichum sp. SAR 10_77]KAJ5002268.1 hypothetical protein K4K48_000330 [Colletotrichum sp. SAR 10_66]